MALTGDADGPPLDAPEAVVERIVALGEGLDVDALQLLGERAATAGLSRRGDVSCGGATRLLETRAGWLAVSLARDDDHELLPAWLGVEATADWNGVAAAVSSASAAELATRGRLLGLAVARVGEVTAPERVVERVRISDERRLGGGSPLVVDLSALWAGPLCAQLLGDRGCRVVKVESVHRPDGARRGPQCFFDLLHAGHESLALDFTDDRDIAILHRVLERADVVIEASRPRALEQLGVDAGRVIASGPRVWVSITGYGRAGERGNDVAFGDDAAAAGGLVAWGDDGRPRFVADAIADPLTGLAAAGAALEALDAGGRWMIDAALARVAAHVAGDTREGTWRPGAGDVAPPRARVPSGRAAALGEHTQALIDELGLR